MEKKKAKPRKIGWQEAKIMEEEVTQLKDGDTIKRIMEGGVRGSITPDSKRKPKKFRPDPFELPDVDVE